MTDKHHSDMKTLNEHISAILKNLTDTSFKTDKHEEQLTDISSKLSKYEDRLNKMSIKETQIQPLSLHITKCSSKFSAYENHLDKLSIANNQKYETVMKKHEDILNTKTDTKIDDIKAEVSISINQILSSLNSLNSH